MASHFPQQPSLSDDDPRIVSIFRGREWISDAPDLYRTLAEQDRIQRIIAEDRRERRQRWVRGFCVAVALFSLIYFMFQLGRGAL